MNTMDMLCDSYYSHDEFVKQARDFAKKTLFTDSWKAELVKVIDPGPTRYGKNVADKISIKF